jgi:GxxExxY protein
MDTNDITAHIVDAAVHVHVSLGPGLMEIVYETVLATALEKRGLRVRRQVPVRFEFEGTVFKKAFRVDLLVQDTVIVELKSVEVMRPVYPKQLLTYLRLMQLPVGLLINFGAPTMKQGLQRVTTVVPFAPPVLSRYGVPPSGTDPAAHGPNAA